MRKKKSKKVVKKVVKKKKDIVAKKRKSAVAKKKKVVAKKTARVVKKAKKVKKVVPKVVRPVVSKAAAPVGYRPAKNEIRMGEVEDYFSHIGVIALKTKGSLSVGDAIHVHGHTTDLAQRIESMQINHGPIQNAKKGDSVGIKVNDKCRKGDEVFRIV